MADRKVTFTPLVGSVVRDEDGVEVGKVKRVDLSHAVGRLKCLLALDSGREVDAVFTREDVARSSPLFPPVLDWRVET